MKMMSWFTSCYQIVSTLFSEGKYNPDRVVAVREGSVKHVYFVAESKDNDLQNSQLRGSEESKIECANLHFKAISDNCYIYDVAKDYKSLYDIGNN